MKVKNVSSIFFTKFNLVYKMILFLLLLTLVLTLLGEACFLPILRGLRHDFAELNADQAVKDYVNAIISGSDSNAAYDNMINVFASVGDLMDKWDTNITVSIVILCVIVFIFAIFYFMAFYTISDIIHQFMQSNSKFGFTSNYVYNMKKSFSFAILYAPLSIILYSICVFASVGLGLLATKISPLLGLFVTSIVAIFILALRRSIFVFWVPNMVVDGFTCGQAFVKNFYDLKGKFGLVLAEYIVVFIGSIVLAFVSGIATFGVGVIVSYAICWLVMQIMDNVEYYRLKGYKFYIDDQTVVDPTKKYKDAVSEEEHFSL